jgi:hypothetical protein
MPRVGSDQSLKPDAATGRMLMCDVIDVASGRREILLVVSACFQHSISNADAIGTSVVFRVPHVVHMGR